MTARLFGEADEYDKLDEIGDPWGEINRLVDFEGFRDTLGACWRKTPEPGKTGGRTPFEAILMFKLLLVDRKCGMSYERLAFMAVGPRMITRFLGLEADDRILDRATIAQYRSLIKDNRMREIFEQLLAHGLGAKDPQMQDASFTLAQRNSKAENQAIKIVNGKTHEAWQVVKGTAKLRQKNGRTQDEKDNPNIYGYMIHICVGVRH